MDEDQYTPFDFAGTYDEVVQWYAGKLVVATATGCFAEVCIEQSPESATGWTGLMDSYGGLSPLAVEVAGIVALAMYRNVGLDCNDLLSGLRDEWKPVATQSEFREAFEFAKAILSKHRHIVETQIIRLHATNCAFSFEVEEQFGVRHCLEGECYAGWGL